jgi:terminal uridylyltransferase
MGRGQVNNTRSPQVPRQVAMPHASQDPRRYPRPSNSRGGLQPQFSQGPSSMPSQRNHQQNTASVPTGSEDDFPALGSTRGTKSSPSSSNAPSQPAGPMNMNQQRAHDFQQRVRGGVYRGQSSVPHQNFQARPQQQSLPQPQQYQAQQFQVDDFRRPPPQNQAVYNPMAASLANQRHALRKRIMTQSEYLETVAEQALGNQMPVEEQQEKEALRLTLERIMHDVITEYGKTQLAIDAAKVKLKCYGSLASGFAVAGSDMDLLVTFPRDGESTEKLEEDIKRLFEKALLDAGYGARLLTQTRVPIMRVCETPTPEILDGLRRYRAKWEQDEQDAIDLKSGNFESNRLPVVTREQIEAVSDLFAKLGDEPGETPLPPSPGRELPHLEYTKDCGIQCDINFSNYVALHNTRLLRTYCLHDERVRRLGLIVKAWAKARKINTPYHGTLSSYGYILMLLHFLMNIASPPVIPNLQIMAKDRDAWTNRTDFETVDGFDVRFVGDREQIVAALEGRPRNQETLGGLLRGFFWYYSDHQGFHWTNDIISIRSPGGSLTKRSKGWTEAKWTGAKNTVRNRYLLCIEDPFETEHNIARTVCHSGIVAIRDEFRRARKIIERVEKVPNVGWQWFEENNEPGQDFIASAGDRGDLLRKDYDFHKLKRLRADAEATEKALKEANALVELEEGGAEASKQDGTSSQHSSYRDVSLEAAPPSRKLTQFVRQQQVNRSPQRGRLRQVRPDSDDEEDNEGHVERGELSAMGKKMPNGKDLSRRSRANFDEWPTDDESEPDCVFSGDFVPRTSDTFGKLLPWDTSTQEGRWLKWRDGKVRNGTFTGILSPGLRILNEQCPFDPLRPHAIFLTGRGDLNLIKPPFPMSKPIEERVCMEDDESSVEDNSNIPDKLVTAVSWDMSVSDCRWLSRRDDMMRAGTFLKPKGEHVRNLDEEFPYLEYTPASEQMRRNEILKARHMRWVRGEISQLEKDNLHSSVPKSEEEFQAGQHEGVGWDMSIADGRWLRNRDELVRAGLFNIHRYLPRTLKLHDQFPYIANTRPAIQKKRNLELRLWGLQRVMAEIPEDVHHALDAETEQDGDENYQVKDMEVPHEPEKVDAKKSCSSNNASPVPGIEAINSMANDTEWDVYNRTGKWLNERDAAIRAGTWIGGRLDRWQRKTDKRFPFLPNPTQEERNERNEALKTWGGQGVVLAPKRASPPEVRSTSQTAQKGQNCAENASETLLVSFSEDDLDSQLDTTDQSWMRIRWDRSTKDGRWLQWRDRKVQQGASIGRLRGRFPHLHASFPYIENPSLEEQAGRNARLLAMQDVDSEKRFTNDSSIATKRQAVKPRRSDAQAANAVALQRPEDKKIPSEASMSKMTWEGSLLGSWFSWRDNKIRNGRWETKRDHKFLLWLESTLPYIAHPTLDQQDHLNAELRAIIADNPQLKPLEGLRHAGRTRPSAEDMINVLSLGKQNAALQAPKELATRTPSTQSSLRQAEHPRSEKDFVRNQGLHFFASQSATTQDARSQDHNPNTAEGLIGKTSLPRTPPSTLPGTNEMASASSSAQASRSNSDSMKTQTLVPQTLHTGPLDTCPRDQDPTIMPIPSMPAFAFDARQLRDLNIIEQGGNGCARFGEEWNIEPDGEWGGGGWMGCKEESSERVELDAKEDKGKWEGRGDEEGLLGELPGL